MCDTGIYAMIFIIEPSNDLLLLCHTEMGPRLKVSSERLEQPEIEPMTPGLTRCVA